MSVAPVEHHEITPARGPAHGGWERRLEDPLSRFYREPLAQLVSGRLLRTRATPDQLMVVGPLFAGLAGYLVSFGGPLHLAAAALAFEVRSIAGRASVALARARGVEGSPMRPAAQWLGAALLYVGIFCHFHLSPPPAGPWSAYVSTNGVLLLAVLQAAIRAFAAGYYTVKYCSIFERGRDETVEALRRKAQSLGPSSTVVDHVEVLVGRVQHRVFERERFDPDRSPPSAGADRVKQLIREEGSPLTRVIAGLWAVSNGEAFLSIVVMTLLLDELWLGQVLFATVGMVWIVGVVLLNVWFLREATRRAKLVVA
jgi:hypothetical protein